MPKLNKEKFDIDGTVKARTTSTGFFELYLHYNASDHYFYFETEDILKCLPDLTRNNVDFAFKKCRSRDMAIMVMNEIISSRYEKKRYLGVKLAISKPVLKNLQANGTILERHIDNQSFNSWRDCMLSVEIERHNSIQEGGTKLYSQVDENWKSNSNIWNPNRHNGMMIEWTPEREQYLMSICEKLDTMAENLVTFLLMGQDSTNGDLGEFIDNQKDGFLLNA